MLVSDVQLPRARGIAPEKLLFLRLRLVRVRVDGLHREGGRGPARRLSERSKLDSWGSKRREGETVPDSSRPVRLTADTKPSIPHKMPCQEQGLDPFFQLSKAPEGSPVMKALKDNKSKASSSELPAPLAAARVDFRSGLLFVLV